MNYKLLLRMLGRTLQVEALCLIIPMLVALYYREDPLPFLSTILPVGILGTLLARLRSNAEFFSQEGFTVVGLIWLSFFLFGALPFWFSGAVSYTHLILSIFNPDQAPMGRAL